jgi:hypothetical protein
MVSWLKDTAKPVAGTSKETPDAGVAYHGNDLGD